MNHDMSEKMHEVLRRYWGYTSFRPFQEQAITSILEEHDTLTVLPTGGGKSLCFQVPALLKDGLAVIVSPLISLMKDQVDYLKELGIPAGCLNSAQTGPEQRAVVEALRAGTLKLLYLAPERLMLDHVRELLKSVRLSFFVIDEAHCISHWGHNFREDYRQLGIIKREFEDIAVHAFTATATPPVRDDIAAQLKLREPHLYVGSVDRPNLTYRVMPRAANTVAQIIEIIGRHPDEPGIIYCLRRSDVDEISDELNRKGYENLPYHAGLSDETRTKNQERFSSEKINIMVATIAFGMGIDRSNIRYIIHAAMPKSIEHYQQETGRAGRDGLAASCYLLYAPADYRTWEYMLRDAADRDHMLAKLGDMYGFCTRPECRHRYLVRYFGQEYDGESCGGCDFCLGEVEMAEEPLIIGQKILSCVLRVKERFGADHVANILKGNAVDGVTERGHEKLSTFGLMSAETKAYIRFMIEQLVGQGFLRREGEYSTLAVTEPGRKLLRGEVAPRLAKPAVWVKKKAAKTKTVRRGDDWEGVDEELFALLRTKRMELATAKGVPAYIVFGDKTLRDMARLKPVTMAVFDQVYGVGETKRKEYGDIFTGLIREYVEKKG